MTTTETPEARPFALFADGGHASMHATKADAITYARNTLGAESFEVYDEDDRQVFTERPVARWV